MTDFFNFQWRKLHLGVNANTSEISAAVLTTNDVGDGDVFPELLSQTQGQINITLWDCSVLMPVHCVVGRSLLLLD